MWIILQDVSFVNFTEIVDETWEIQNLDPPWVEWKIFELSLRNKIIGQVCSSHISE